MESQNQDNREPNLIEHPNGSVDDPDAGNRQSNKPSVISSISRDLGLGDDFVKDIGKDLVKGFVKDKLGLSRKESNKSKFGRTVDTIKGMWWVPAAVYISLALGVLLIKYLSRMMGI